MQSSNVQDIQPVEELLRIIVEKEADIHSYRQQVDMLQKKLSEHREKDDSLTDSSGSHRGPLIRARSDPIPGQTKRNSNPEVFLFPEAKMEDFQNKEPPSFSNINRYTSGNNQMGYTMSNKVDVGNGPDASLDLRSNIPASWLDTHMASQGCPGVSEQYFKNVLNELVKTKKFLNNLLMQKHGPDRSVEMNNMRHELQQLEFTKQHLQRELDESREENSNLKQKIASTRSIKADASFELESTFMMGLSEGTQTDQALDVIQVLTNQLKKMGVEKQTLDREHKKILYTANNLMEENHALKKELTELQTSQKNLSTQVMSLSTLLQEQHKKTKTLEDGHRNKSSEAKELSEKLCILRQKYEELMGEKDALEKNVALMGSRMRLNQQTRPITQPGQSIPGRFHSHDKSHLHSSSSTSQGDSSKKINSYTGSTSHSLKHKTHSSEQDHTPPRLVIPDQTQRRVHSTTQGSPLNNLSPKEPEERKVSNIPSHLAQMIQSQDYECPTCLQTFDTETSYLAHLEKCLE